MNNNQIVIVITSLLFASLALFNVCSANDILTSGYVDQGTSNNSVEFTLHESEQLVGSTPEFITFNIPFPPKYLLAGEGIRLKHGKKNIQAFSEPQLFWLDTNNNKNSIRSLSVTISGHSAKLPLKLTLSKIPKIDNNLSRPSNYNRFKIIKTSLDESSSSNIGSVTINVPYVYAIFSADWLGNCLLRNRSLPINENKKLKWFDEAFINFTKSFADSISENDNKNQNIDLSEPAPWMYDLGATFFNAYIKTGELRYLKIAHKLSQQYASLINEEGHFLLKKRPDIKYSYNLSLLIDYILFGDVDLLPTIEAVANFTSNWKIDYKFSDKFWTERHQTYSLLGSTVAWEATGKTRYLEMATKISKATINEAKYPENDWQSQGCVLHTVRSHEGDDDDRPACSPWMSALLSEAMFRYYIITGDMEALDFVYNLANFVVSHGINKVVEDGKMNGMHVPWYLASNELEYTDNGPWDDREHACDVAGLLARGHWAGKRLNKDIININEGTDNLLFTCKKTFNRWHRTSKSTNKKFWKNAPPRKYNWWFGSTSDLTFLHQH